jgi:hypothetical protein
VIAAAALVVVGGASIMLSLPTYSSDWPQRINLEYWMDVDTGRAHYLVQSGWLALPAGLAAAAHFDPVPRPRFAGSSAQALYAEAPALELPPPELALTSSPRPAGESATHFELGLRSVRGAPEALVVFPAEAKVTDITLDTAAAPLPAKLSKLTSGATLLDVVGLPPEGLRFSIDASGRSALTVQVFDQSYAFPAGALTHARPATATSSQDGDVTVVHRTVSLDPAANRSGL